MLVPALRTPALLIASTLFVIATAACTAVQSDEKPVVEARSLRGTPLYRPVLDRSTKSRLEADLAAARSAASANPRDESAIIWVGRRLAYLGRYREAVDVFTDGLAAHPDSPRLLRHRAHRFITLRRFDDAIADLARAAALTADTPDETEPDGMPNARNLPRSTLKTNIWYHLGLAHFLKGETPAAIDAYSRCLELSRINDDMLVATAYWLVVSLRLDGLTNRADAVLDLIHPEMDIIENTSYHRLLLLHKGLIPASSLATDAKEGSLDWATLGAGLGYWYLIMMDRPRAEAHFERVSTGPGWASFGFIAAEAQLVRWNTAALNTP